MCKSSIKQWFLEGINAGKATINHPFGNGWNPTYKNGDDWGMCYYCTHICRKKHDPHPSARAHEANELRHVQGPTPVEVHPGVQPPHLVEQREGQAEMELHMGHVSESGGWQYPWMISEQTTRIQWYTMIYNDSNIPICYNYITDRAQQQPPKKCRKVFPGCE